MTTDGDPLAIPTGGLSLEPLVHRVQGAFAGSRGTLRASLAMCLAVVALFAVLASGALTARRAELVDARESAAEVVLVQTVRTALVEADALATNAFLVGGLEPAEQRDAYQEGIDTASRNLVRASASAGATGSGTFEALESANASLIRYTGLIESARANNRQGFPVGVAYLKQASALMQSDILPVLDGVLTDNQSNVSAAYEGSRDARLGLWVAALLLVAVLVAAQVLLSRATRRTLNIGVFAGSLLVGLALIIAIAAMSSAASQADDARRRSYRDVTTLTQARIDAFGAKSAESLTLVARGNGAAFEEEWAVSQQSATDALEGRLDDLLFLLQRYGGVHAEIRELDDGGQWDEAVALATGFEIGSSNEAFNLFDDESARLLDDAALRLSTELADATSGLAPARIWVLVLSVLAAGLIAWGHSQRLREYR